MGGGKGGEMKAWVNGRCASVGGGGEKAKEGMETGMAHHFMPGTASTNMTCNKALLISPLLMSVPKTFDASL